jgi:2-methylisocitrate lyase-like PEP mutase family enzyme
VDVTRFARAVEGLDAAIDRAAAYREAGADILFVEAPQSVAELEVIPARLPGSHLANIVFGGKTPDPGRAELAKMGFSLVLYANAALQAAALHDVRAPCRDCSLTGVEDALASFAERQVSRFRGVCRARSAIFRAFVHSNRRTTGNLYRTFATSAALRSAASAQ